MRKIERIKLSHLSDDEVNRREMNAFRGGYGTCWCSCQTCTSCNCSIFSSSTLGDSPRDALGNGTSSILSW